MKNGPTFTGIQSAALHIYPIAPDELMSVELKIVFSDNDNKEIFTKFIVEEKKKGTCEFKRLRLDTDNPAALSLCLPYNLHDPEDFGPVQANEDNLQKILALLTKHSDFDFEKNTSGRYASFPTNKKSVPLLPLLPLALFNFIGFLPASILSFGAFTLHYFREKFKEKSLNYFESKEGGYSFTQHEKSGFQRGVQVSNRGTIDQISSVFDVNAYNKEFLTGYYAALEAKADNRNPPLVEKIVPRQNLKTK